MSEENISVEQKIILAAIECIEEEGMQAITIRSIAKKAGVNVAAINYYFRSKENLINAVLNSTRNHMLMDLKEMLEHSKWSAKTKLVNMLQYLLEGATKYPRLSKAHFHDSFVKDKEEWEFALQFNSILNDLQKILEQANVKEKGKRLKFSLIQTISAVMFTGIFPFFYQDFIGKNFLEDKVRKDYINSLVRFYFN